MEIKEKTSGGMEIKNFLENHKELLQSAIPDERIHPKIVGSYVLDKNDVSNHVIDWVVNYLGDRDCPYPLSITIAKETSRHIITHIEEQLEQNGVDQSKLLYSVSLYSETITRLRSVCDALSNQPDPDGMFAAFKVPFGASAFGIKNRRRKMEDRHVLHHNLNRLLDLEDTHQYSYYAVFDGHSGVDAAGYAAAHMHVNIANHPAFHMDTETAVRDAFKITDDGLVAKFEKERIKSGTTAVCALIKDNILHLAWVGDSQAVLVREGEILFVSSMHKPDKEEERHRIESLGGNVIFLGTWRVNGCLAVTRALGDADHKPYITSEPELHTCALKGDEDFLILACDGLWDVMSVKEAGAAVYHGLMKNSTSDILCGSAKGLVRRAEIGGSDDNITAVVVFLRDINEIKESLLETNVLEKINLGAESDVEVDSDSPNPSPNRSSVKSMALDLKSPFGKAMNNANPFGDVGSFGDDFGGFGRSLPEATDLSELPTPPIDEIMPLGFAAVAQDVPSGSAYFEKDLADFRYSQSPSVVPVDAESKASCNDSIDANAEETMTPEKAVDIASSVVSSTIENAIKCVSLKEVDDGQGDIEQSPTFISAQKLNPFAEPFVMKNFIPSSPDVPSGFAETPERSLGISKDNTVSENVFQSAPADENSLLPENAMQSNAVENLLEPPSPSSQSMTSTANVATELSDLVNKTGNVSEISTVAQISSGEVGSHVDLMRQFEETPQAILVDQHDDENVHYNAEVGNGDSGYIPFESESFDTIRRPTAEKNDVSGHESSSITCGLESMTLNEKVVCTEEPVHVVKDSDNLTFSSLDDPAIKENVLKVHVSYSSEDSNVLTGLVDNALNVQERREISACGDVLNISNVSNQSSIDLIGMHENLMSALPLTQAEDVHVDTVAVDLQSIPVEIPEAEGVTEDIDSDSEKDGGWSYVKTATAKVDKPKTEAITTPDKVKSARTPTTDPPKPKKEVMKFATTDTKGRVRSATFDKNKKPPIEKKVIESKVKINAVKSTSATMPKPGNAAIGTKPVSTLRVKKEATAPKPIGTATKPTIAATQKLAKDAVDKPRAQVAPLRAATLASKPATKPVSTVRPISAPKPKSALPDQKPKSGTVPTAPSAKAASNQNVKSAVSARTTTLLRTTAAPALSAKPASSRPAPKANTSEAKPKATSNGTEVKPRAPVTTLKRTVPTASRPASSTLKKPGDKEAKDIANKQISAKKTTSTTIASRATAPKSSATSKLLPNGTKVTRSTNVKKDEAKKDAPALKLNKAPVKSTNPVKSAKAPKPERKEVVEEKEADKTVEKSNGSSEKDVNSAESTPVTEEEKFIHEMADKEVKGDPWTAENSENNHGSTENTSEVDNIKSLDDISTPSPVSESLI